MYSGELREAEGGTVAGSPPAVCVYLRRDSPPCTVLPHSRGTLMELQVREEKRQKREAEKNAKKEKGAKYTLAERNALALMFFEEKVF